jgi:SHS2 domain-containing protein
VPGIKRYELFPHQADIGIRGRGGTEAAAFEQAAIALTAAVTNPADVHTHVPVEIRCEGPNSVTLFVDWINALIYEMGVRKMLFARFEVAIDQGKLMATAWGEPVDRRRHEPAAEPKGATYTEARVQCEAGVWTAQCVVDV